MGQNAWVSISSSDYEANRWRENTISSFLSCIQAGATFIEFDVQCTSDGVPVVWHDNYMVFGDSANPSSLPISQLSLAEFKSLAPIRSSSSFSAPSFNCTLDDGDEDEDMDMALAGASPQSTISSISITTTSTCTNIIHSSSSLSYPTFLMRQGRNDLPALPGDPSLRQWQVQQEDDLPTLKEVFEAMPAAVAFDIEIKMTTPPHVAQTCAEEVDRVVTAILAAVDAAEADWPTSNHNGGGRMIVYSSFDPEVCLEVRKRRPEACIMFLSDCGEHPYVDDRRNSAGAAIEFACNAGLQGVILESTVVKSDPGVVRVAGEKGLRVMTYGTLNDDEEWVGVQGLLGVCGVIVDDVERVVKAMR